MAGGTIQKKIEIWTTFLTTGLEKQRQIPKYMKEQDDMSKRLGVTTGYLADKMKMAHLELGTMREEGKQVVGYYDSMNKTWINSDKAVKVLNRSFARFRMELLGIMFFGMAVSKFFGKFVTGALKMTGILDVLNVVMSMLVLPVLMPFVKIGYQLIGMLMKSHPLVRWFAGAFIVLGFVMGTALFMFGQLGLGLGSLAIVLSKAGLSMAVVSKQFAIARVAATGFMVSIAPILLLVAAFTSLYLIIRKLSSLWKEMSGQFGELQNILGTTGFMGTVAGGFGALKGVRAMQHGGIVTRPTLAVLGERGPEAVVPLGGGAFMPTVNVYATVSGDVEINRLADEITNRIEEQLYRRMRSKIL